MKEKINLPYSTTKGLFSFLEDQFSSSDLQFFLMRRKAELIGALGERTYMWLWGRGAQASGGKTQLEHQIREILGEETWRSHKLRFALDNLEAATPENFSDRWEQFKIWAGDFLDDALEAEGELAVIEAENFMVNPENPFPSDSLVGELEKFRDSIDGSEDFARELSE